MGEGWAGVRGGSGMMGATQGIQVVRRQQVVLVQKAIIIIHQILMMGHSQKQHQVTRHMMNMTQAMTSRVLLLLQ